MSKNRSRSPFTGSHKLSKDPHEARAIRQKLAHTLRDLAAEAGAETTCLNLHPISYRSILQPGRMLRISFAQIEFYGRELVAKELLTEVRRHVDESLLFFPSDQGWKAIRRGHPRLVEALKAEVTTELSSRKKAREQETVSLSRPTKKRKFGAGEDDPFPTARELLVPILELARESPIRLNLTEKLLALHIGFPTKHIHLPKPINTNQTFSSLTRYAIKFLIEKDLLTPKTKALKLTALGRDTLARGDAKVWRNFVEPVVKVKTTVIHKLPAEARQAYYAVRLDLDRALQGIQEIDPLKLIAKWENAHRILADVSKRDQHALVQLVIERLEEEWQRRNASSNVADHFEWPTTEANFGDGSLSLDDIQKNGALSCLDYHVGRTRGEPDAHRRRTLAKIFEQPFPGELSVLERDEWGPSGSAMRLRKMAYSIAAFTRSAKRRNHVILDEAIRQWETDLRFLHDQYYAGTFNFGWPSTIVRARPDK